MSKNIIYVSFWTNQLEELVSFLKANEYSDTELRRIQDALNASTSV